MRGTIKPNAFPRAFESSISGRIEVLKPIKEGKKPAVFVEGGQSLLSCFAIQEVSTLHSEFNGLRHAKGTSF
ncbi:hypothetical protein CEXT_256651 [Caerostris extrusa]|uniref:Uncharacterized protein n=1 Tax=Caerostris extrusa TaxID=172846 RepID=A0AAV4R5L6_CAEEX|nr:hypothetical protein CEXT_256651 [Caerostris extrusa]